jgi:hypothetical protein
LSFLRPGHAATWLGAPSPVSENADDREQDEREGEPDQDANENCDDFGRTHPLLVRLSPSGSRSSRQFYGAPRLLFVHGGGRMLGPLT